MSKEKRAFWYDNGLRPAIKSRLGSQIASQWPATYAAEELRAGKSTGGYSWSTKVIPKEEVEYLADSIRHELCMNDNISAEDRRWASDFFIMHTIRGVKHGTYHHADSASAEFYLRGHYADAQLSPLVPDYGEWYVDVGIEISSVQEHCLQWRTTGHRIIVEQALHITPDQALKIASFGSSRYALDSASHLPDLSGFRLETGTRTRGIHDASYIHAYTTDKAVVYNIQGSRHSKYVTMKEALGSEDPLPTIDSLHDIYDQAKYSNPSNARLEVRVPAAFAPEALLDIDPHALQHCLAVYTKQEWW